jgi:hypothetical protein
MADAADARLTSARLLAVLALGMGGIWLYHHDRTLRTLLWVGGAALTVADVVLSPFFAIRDVLRRGRA